jgi:hypothetical protein
MFFMPPSADWAAVVSPRSGTMMEFYGPDDNWFGKVKGAIENKIVMRVLGVN